MQIPVHKDNLIGRGLQVEKLPVGNFIYLEHWVYGEHLLEVWKKFRF